MPNLAEQILEHANALSEGVPLRAKELVHLGNRAALHQSLSRLVRSGHLLRAARGLYLRPVETRFGIRPPTVHKVIEAFAPAKLETVVLSGAAAASELGLTTQVPVRMVYLTSGRSRVLSVGSQSVELRHAPCWQLELPASRAGQAIRAFAWFGRERAAEAAQMIRGKLSAAELQLLTEVQWRLPGWIAERVSALART